MHRDTNVTHIAYKTFRRRVNDTDGRIFFKFLLQSYNYHFIYLVELNITSVFQIFKNKP